MPASTARNRSVAARFPAVRRWVNHAASWRYVDPQGSVLGRVDVVCDDDNRLWFWWQTSHRTDQSPDLDAAMRAVERALAHQRVRSGSA